MRLNLISICVVLSTSSCVLPIPHKRLHGPGASGVIIDAHTKSPITGATVAPVDADSAIVVTDERGHFTILPRYGWHGAAVVGPIGSSLFPSLSVTTDTREVTTSADGYQKLNTILKARYSGNEWTEWTQIELKRNP